MAPRWRPAWRRPDAPGWPADSSAGTGRHGAHAPRRAAGTARPAASTADRARASRSYGRTTAGRYARGSARRDARNSGAAASRPRDTRPVRGYGRSWRVSSVRCRRWATRRLCAGSPRSGALVTVGFDGIHRSSMATAASGCRPDLRKRPFHSRRRTECDPAPRGLHENLPYGIESRRKSAATSIGEKRETGFPATRARHARSTC